MRTRSSNSCSEIQLGALTTCKSLRVTGRPIVCMMQSYKTDRGDENAKFELPRKNSFSSVSGWWGLFTVPEDLAPV